MLLQLQHYLHNHDDNAWFITFISIANENFEFLYAGRMEQYGGRWICGFDSVCWGSDTATGLLSFCHIKGHRSLNLHPRSQGENSGNSVFGDGFLLFVLCFPYLLHSAESTASEFRILPLCTQMVTWLHRQKTTKVIQRTRGSISNLSRSWFAQRQLFPPRCSRLGKKLSCIC